MPIEKDNCDDCGRKRDICPECGGTHVTPFENASSAFRPNWIARYGSEERFTFSHVCWDCGWEERVTVTFDREQL